MRTETEHGDDYQDSRRVAYAFRGCRSGARDGNERATILSAIHHVAVVGNNVVDLSK